MDPDLLVVVIALTCVLATLLGATVDMAVRETKGWSDIRHLPKQSEYVRGVRNINAA